jgi:hypothetical protein
MNTRVLLGFVALATGLGVTQPVKAASVNCTMRFDLTSWSILYKRSDGTGTITCSDRTILKVKLTANGGGLTVGKATIKGGKGNFSAVNSIEETLGTYVAADASFGTPKSGTAQVMTKGEVSLSLAGAGKGFGLGVSLGGLTIAKDR